MEDTIWSGLQDWAGVDIKNQLIIFTVLAVWRENKPFFFWHSFFCKGLAEWPGAAVGEVPDWTMLLLLDNPSPLGAVSLCVTVWVKLCSPTADSWPCPMPCHARWELVQTPLLWVRGLPETRRGCENHSVSAPSSWGSPCKCIPFLWGLSRIACGL